MYIFKKVKFLITKWFLLINGASLKKGAIIYPGVEISNKKAFTIDINSIIYKNCTFYIYEKGQFYMGKNSHIASYGYFLIGNQKLEIGDDVAIGPFCSMFCISNSVKGENKLFRKNYTAGDIRIGNNVFIGSHCIVLPGTVINDNVVIAANSLVNGILESGFVYGGSPVKKLKSIYE